MFLRGLSVCRCPKVTEDGGAGWALQSALLRGHDASPRGEAVFFNPSTSEGTFFNLCAPSGTFF